MKAILAFSAWVKIQGKVLAKETTAEALEGFHHISVRVKILTGDNEVVTRNICRQVGLSVDRILVGQSLEEMTRVRLAQPTEGTIIFAKLSPAHKESIIRALQQQGYVV